MFKKLISLALSVMMVMALIAIPTHAAGFSSANWKQHYNTLETPSGNFNGEVLGTTVLDGEEFNTHVKSVGNSSTTINNNRNPIKYGTLNSKGEEAPKFTHFRVLLGAYEDGGRTGLDKFWVMLHNTADGAATQAFCLRGDTGRSYPDGTGDNILENYNKDLWSLRSSTTDTSFHKIDLIVDHNSLQSSTALVYMFIDGKYAGVRYESSKKDAIGTAFYGVSFRVLSGTSVNTNTIIEAKFEEGREGHREYFDANGYTVTLEDVLNDAGLGDATEEENVIFHTTAIERYIPDAVQARELYYKDGSNTSRKLNDNVTYDGTAAIISQTNSAADTWELAADVLAFYPYSKTDGRKGGVSYTSYHPSARYIKLSFDQTIAEDEGTDIRYDLFASSNTEALKFRDNNGKLAVALKNADAKTTDGEIYGTNRIDWVIEMQDTEVNSSYAANDVYQYVYVNGEKVAEASLGSSTYLRLNNIQMYTKNSTEVTIDDWSMTLYNQDADFADIEAAITGVEPATTFEWMEDSCYVATNGEIFVVSAGVEAKRYEGAASFVVAAFAADGSLLDTDIKDFASGVVIGNEDEPKIFNTVYGEKAVDHVNIYLWENGTLCPLIVNKSISATDFVEE